MKKLFVCAMALAAFVSCSKDEIQGPALDSKNKTVEILVQNGAPATRAALDGTSAGVTAPGTADKEGGNTLASATAQELYVLFAAGDVVKEILPLSGTDITGDDHSGFDQDADGMYVVGDKVADASAKGGIIYTWHNVPWEITSIAVVRIDEVLDAEYFTVNEDGSVATITEKSIAKYVALASNEAENLDRELSEIVLFGQAALSDTGKTHEVGGITYHYWRADVEVAPKFARFEITNIECEDLGILNTDGINTTYGFDELDVLSLSWTSLEKKSYQIEVANDAVIGTLYGKYNPATVKSEDQNRFKGDAASREAGNEDDIQAGANAVWSWNVLPTSWTDMKVGLKAYAYDYKLADGNEEAGTSGRDLTLDVDGLNGKVENYPFAAGNIYKLNLKFKEEHVKDKDALCVEVTVDIKPWTIVDNLNPVFNND